MTIQYSIKIEKQLKDNAMEVANKLGMPLSALTKAFYHYLINTQRVTFSFKENKDLDQVIDQALQSVKVKNSFKKMAEYVQKHPVKK